MAIRRILAQRTVLAPFAALALAASGCAASAPSGPSGPPSMSAGPSGATSQATDGRASGAASGRLTIGYEENAQVELVSSTGRRVLVDVWNPAALTAPPSANDILLTTHSHSDHYLADFVDAFPGQKLTFKTGRIQLPDVTVTGIAAAHDEGSEIAPEGGSDYIYVVEVDGLRIAHFGDLGQDALTPEQLAAIGRVDVAISQLANPYSSMDETNRKGLNEMAQVKPRLLIPTHMTAETARLATTVWMGLYAAGPITIVADRLPSTTTVLFMGTRAADYGKILKLAPSGW